MRKAIPRKLIVAFLLLCCILIVGTIGYMIIEGWGLIDSFYMSVITLTTVGYSEVNPLSNAGRLFTICILLGGFGILTYGITSLISFLLEGELGAIIRRQRMDKVIQKMENHFIVCANDETGKFAIEEFHKTSQPFVIITNNEELVKDVEDINVPIIIDNPAEDEVLEKAGIDHAKGLITALGEDKSNLFVVLSARALNQEIRIVTQAIDKTSAMKLKKAGADEVVLTDAIGGMRIASAMLRPTVVTFLDSMLKEKDDPLRIEEVTITDKAEFKGKTIANSKISEKTGLLVVAIKSMTSSKYIYNPGHNYKLEVGDVLITIGSSQQLEKLNKLAG